ncbi:hypothetical protein B0H12DRAFT_1161298 [Mycena haematopus]|nr:hypothetical protein B0H12DRAFT_1161298 [Mycena haematopus]
MEYKQSRPRVHRRELRSKAFLISLSSFIIFPSESSRKPLHAHRPVTDAPGHGAVLCAFRFGVPATNKRCLALL